MRRREFVTRFGSGLPTSRRWLSSTALAAVVGVAYYLAGRLGVGLILKPEGVAVFWPAAGISSGVLIALGRLARWPVAAGVIAATVVVHLAIADPLWAGVALGVSNAAEALITAGLIEHYFGEDFALDRLRQVIGLLIAAVVGTAISGIGGAVTYRVLSGPSAEMLTSWQHWFASDVIGIIIVAPLVIGLAAALRRQPPHSELIEGAVALLALAIMTAIVIVLPPEFWVTVLPIAALFPILLWITARCRPVYAAAAAFLVSITFVATAVFSVGHFGDTTIAFTDRILQAQSAILFVALGTFVLAALFAESRDSEARLTRSNMMLERERDNKLMSAQAITGVIAHEVRQPLASIVANASAALRWLERTPPDHDEVRIALNRIQGESHRTSDVFDGIRALFRKGDQGRQRIDVNEIIVEVLQSLRGELKDHGVETRSELAELPLVDGNGGQLREVILNLIYNALEAMDTTTDQGRLLRVTTERRGPDITVAVEDSDRELLPRNWTAYLQRFLRRSRTEWDLVSPFAV